ncbi:Txe/YoeB family addiction module toxin [Nitrosomonas sp.]|uniref:Txe/YoeB family addiction module toxin n=1 Tax=Nitrosomonas sp. TaxID=42353 RepID=UPI002842515C|nr:Txe/YoeB family addiction module toxin [Nitrosomonas sp.]MDR4514285.1 Txe/YoeB family addiction module toxin [Nitrosomonas sp.]
MIISWAENAWINYLYWQKTDREALKRINTLIKDFHCQPFNGLGDSEPLEQYWSGYWSRRIDRENRLVTEYRRS